MENTRIILYYEKHGRQMAAQDCVVQWKAFPVMAAGDGQKTLLSVKGVSPSTTCANMKTRGGGGGGGCSSTHCYAVFPSAVVSDSEFSSDSLLKKE